MRRNNKADMTIPEQIEAIREQICDKYCRFPDVAKSTHDNEDEAFEWLMQNYCEKCPMRDL